MSGLGSDGLPGPPSVRCARGGRRGSQRTESWVWRRLPLAILAPDIVESVLAGTQPVHVTTELLTKRVDLPIDWKEQQSLLGFERAPAS